MSKTHRRRPPETTSSNPCSRSSAVLRRSSATVAYIRNRRPPISTVRLSDTQERTLLLASRQKFSSSPDPAMRNAVLVLETKLMPRFQRKWLEDQSRPSGLDVFRVQTGAVLV